MFKFFEPEDEYKTEKGRRRNIKTKINLMTFLIIFFGILIFAVQQDFVKVFGRGTFKEYCVLNNSYSAGDDKEFQFFKAEKALSDHLGTLRDLDGYLDSKIEFGSFEDKSNVPIINLLLNKNSTEKERIPEFICGYKVIIKTE